MCSEGDVLVRPGANSLVQMNIVYYYNILLVPISVWVFLLSTLITPW